MKTRFPAVCLLVLAAVLVPHRAKAPPPPPPMGPPPASTPGAVLGSAGAYWIAPYVSVSNEEIKGHRTQTVTWFSEDGSVRKQITSPREIAMYANPGYLVRNFENGQYVLHGLTDPWTRALSRYAGGGGPYYCTINNRTYIQELGTGDGQVSYEVYIHGVFANKIGPFFFGGGPGLRPSEDGAMALLTWKDATRTARQIVSVNSEAMVEFQVDCGETDQEPIQDLTPAPWGRAVLVRCGNRTQTFHLYTRHGKERSMEQAGASCIGWMPGTLKSLLGPRYGGEGRFRMVDWETGKVLWDIPPPEEMQVTATGFTPKLVIFTGAERYQGGPWKGSAMRLAALKTPLIRAMVALSAEDGHMVAHWRDPYPTAFAGYEENGCFVQLEKKLVFFTREEFTELSEEDIMAAKNGWTR